MKTISASYNSQCNSTQFPREGFKQLYFFESRCLNDKYSLGDNLCNTKSLCSQLEYQKIDNLYTKFSSCIFKIKTLLFI